MTPSNTGLKAVIFDWAGTTVDFGSRAPVEAFVEIFRRSGVEISVPEARGPMGRAKRDHIAAICAVPRVAQAWRARHGQPPTDADVERLYVDFLPLQMEVLARHCDVIPGVPEVIKECRRRGLRIGSSTGYTRELMEIAAPLARAGGFDPETIVCADDVPQGRPAPWMLYRAAERLNVYPMSAIVAVDDTPVGIEAGLNAGAWTVAVTWTGNSLGLSEAELTSLPKRELEERLTAVTEQFRTLGAHHVIPDVTHLPGVLDRIA